MLLQKKNGRNFIGIERDEKYIKVANKRIEHVEVEINDVNTNSFDIKPPLVPMKELVKKNYLKVGDVLYNKNKSFSATVKLDGNIITNELNGSIHKVSAHFLNISNNNGWDFWYIEKEDGLKPISEIRKNYIINEL